jgi:hypothetical protein
MAPPNPERMVDHAMEFDADKDGKLSREELLSFAREMPRPMGPPPGPGPGGPEGGNGPGGRGRRPPGPGGPGGRGNGPEPERPRRPAAE